MTIEQKLMKAKVGLILNQPFFATLMMKKEFIIDSTIKTANTNGKQIRFSPSLLEELPNDELQGVIAHELLHGTCLHHTRRNGRDLSLWNEACDYAINPLLIASGFKLPSWVLMDKAFENMSAEDIYKLREQQKKEEQRKEQEEKQRQEEQENDSQGQGSGAGDDNEEEQDDQQDDSGQPDPDDNEEEQDNDDSSDDQQDGNGDGTDEQKDDDSADSDQSENEETDEQEETQDSKEASDKPASDPDPGKMGGVIDAPAKTDSEMAQEEAEMKQEIAQAVAIAKQQGKLPGYMERLINEIMEPRVAWQEVLARFLSEVCHNDYSFSRPNTRYIGSGFILPSLYNTEVGEIVLMVDTSCSIDEELLNKFAGEMQDIVSDYKSPIKVLYIDTVVAGEQEIEPDDIFKLEPKGGGGTDFRPGFEWLEEQGITPKAVVYFTDGACDDYPEEPEYPVLWAQTGGYKFKPPFGEVIKID